MVCSADFGEFQHPEAIAPLVELLKTDEDEELKAIAVTVLGQMGTVAIAALSELLLEEETRLFAVRSQHPVTEIVNIKSAIALSLGQLGEIQAIEPLISLLADSNASVRLDAIAALKNLDREAAHQ